MDTVLKALHLKKDDQTHVQQTTHNNFRPADQYPTQQATYQNHVPQNYQNTMPQNYQNTVPQNYQDPHHYQNTMPQNYQNMVPQNYQDPHHYQNPQQNHVQNAYPNPYQQNNYPGAYSNAPTTLPGTVPDNFQTVPHSGPHTSHNTAPTTGDHSTPNTCWNFQLPPTNDYDFLERDRLAEHHMNTTKEKIGSWGPHPPKFPKVDIPHGVDPVAWSRHRVVEVAQRYVGLPYQHHHIPLWVSSKDGQGVDCSNFSSWVYNYALGIHFTSHCGKQADGDEAPGRKLQPSDPLEVGDLLFLLKGDKSCISHVVIYMGNGKIIDSGKGGVCIRNHAGWYKSHHLFTRRILE